MDRITRSEKIVLFLSGLVGMTAFTVLIGWHLSSPSMVQFFQNTVSMKYNTALCFLFSSSVLILTIFGQKKAAAAVGMAIVAMGFVIFLQYVFHLNFGIDEWLIRDFTAAIKTTDPGRMSPQTCICFMMFGLVPILTCLLHERKSRLLVSGLFGSAIFVMSSTSLFGYFFGLENAYSWGAATGIAFHAAGCFLLLGISFILLSWNREDNPYMPFIVAAAIGTIFALQIYYLVVNEEKKVMEIEFKHHASIQIDFIRDEVDSNLNVLQSLRSYYDSSIYVDRKEFRSFCKTILETHKSIRAIGWQPRVILAERDSYVKKAREEGYPYFEIKTLKSNQTEMSVSGVQAEYFPIYYLEPFETNKQVFGMDVSTTPSAKALEMARDTGQMSAAGKIVLPQDPQENYAYLVYQAIYSKDPSEDSMAWRRAHLLGFVGVVFQIQDVVERALRMSNLAGIDVEIYDLSQNASDQLLYRHSSDSTQANYGQASSRALRYSESITIAGRDLTVLCLQTSEFTVIRSSWIAIYASIGTLICFLIAGLYLVSTFQRLTIIQKTVRKQTDELWKSDQFNKTLLNSTSYAIISTDLNGAIVSFNKTAEKMMGYSAKEALGLSPTIFTIPSEVEEGARNLSKRLGRTIEPGFEVFVALARQNVIEDQEFTCLRKDGSQFSALLVVTPLHDITGKISGFLGLVSDITQRKRSETALKESEIWQRNLFMESRDAIMTLEPPTWKFTSGNPATLRMFRARDEQEFTSCEPWKLSPPTQPDGRESGEKAKEMIEKAMKNGSHSFEWTHKRLSGEEFYAEVLLSRVSLVDHAFLHAIVRDITERKAVETEVRNLSRVVEQSPSSIVITDTKGNIEYVNPKFVEVTGYSYEDAIGKNPRILKSGNKSPEEYKKLWQTITSGNEWRGEFHNKKKNGELYWELASISPMRDENGKITHFLAIKEDITARKDAERIIQEDKKKIEAANQELVGSERVLKSMIEQVKKTQSQLIQSDRLAAIGQLAAGVAHEINNPIGFITSNLSTLDQYVSSIGEMMRLVGELRKIISEEKDLEKAIQCVKQLDELSKKNKMDFILDDLVNLVKESRNGTARIIKIVSDLKSFARSDMNVFAPTDLHQVLESSINIIWHEIKYKAELKKEYGDIPSVNCNGQQIGQVVMNMLVNASQAIEGKGVITIRTFKKDSSVCIEIQDTGKGIPKDIIDKIYDPFFTTKDVGVGTGLGLSIGHDIICKKHHGDIHVESEVGKGTKFTISLPL